MPCLLFFCILDVMNTSQSCSNTIAWYQASLCNAEHLFGALNKIVVFHHFYALLQLCVDILYLYLIEADCSL